MKQAGRPAVVGIGVLVVAALAMVGCSEQVPAAPSEGGTTTAPSTSSAEAPGEQEPAPEVEERAPGPSEGLQIVEASAWPDGMGKWLYAVVVENPSDELAYFADRFEVQAVDGDGTVVDSSTTYDTVLPGSRTVVTDAFRNLDGLGVATFTVTTPETATVVEPGSVGHLEVSEVGFSTDDDGYEALVGTVTSHFADPQSNAGVIAIFRDSSGQIVHVDGGGIFEDVPPGEDLEFSILMEAPDDAVPEVYAYPDAMVQDPTALRSIDGP